MKDWVKLTAILALLLYSIIGQQVAGHVSHAHLLIGPVTPEQLLAHEELEEQGGQPIAVSYLSDKGPAIQRGIIVSLLFGPDASRIPIALNGAFLVVVLVSTIYSAVSPLRSPGYALALSPQDPPPRFMLQSA
jgi:hypothetical protein